MPRERETHPQALLPHPLTLSPSHLLFPHKEPEHHNIPTPNRDKTKLPVPRHPPPTSRRKEEATPTPHLHTPHSTLHTLHPPPSTRKAPAFRSSTPVPSPASAAVRKPIGRSGP